MAADTIDGIIASFDRVVDRARERGDRVGYFAALYRNVTRRVKGKIAAGAFEDAARMERLDVVFANRYLDALDAFEHGRTASRCWTVAFTTYRSWQPIIVQQMLVGTNAHINLDLGVAAAQVAPGDELASLQHDFDTINGLLADMLDGVKDDIDQVSPWVRLLDRVDPSGEDAVINFAMDKARANAWSTAMRLAHTPPDRLQEEIDVVDRWTAVLGNLIVHPPGFLLNAGLRIIRARETNDVRRVIDVMCSVSPTGG